MNVLICGATGKMGRKVFDACKNFDNVNAVCGVSKESDFSNPSFPIYDCFESVKEKVDMIIDFSHKNALSGILDYALKNKINAVLCSTGYDNADILSIEKASKKIAVFRSANMSLGVNVLIDLVKQAAKALKSFDIEIIEKHHNQKVDAPSGTALMLSDAVKGVCPEKFETFGRQGNCKRDKNEIGVHAVRGGTIVGEHDVLFAGEFETLTLSHQAFDRSVFANGAIKASIYLSDKKTGLYDMNDLIKGN